VNFLIVANVDFLEENQLDSRGSALHLSENALGLRGCGSRSGGFGVLAVVDGFAEVFGGAAAGVEEDGLVDLGEHRGRLYDYGSENFEGNIILLVDVFTHLFASLFCRWPDCCGDNTCGRFAWMLFTIFLT